MDYFDKYAKSYDFKITEISYKYYHSYRVKDLMIVIAKSMNLPIYDVELAGIIGLLHDIGRFPQFERFHSFDDSNIDHGNLGEEILRKDKALKNYDIKEEDSPPTTTSRSLPVSIISSVLSFLTTLSAIATDSASTTRFL